MHRTSDSLGASTLALAGRSVPLPVDPAGIPRELVDEPAWVVWRIKPKPGKPGEWTKVPCQATNPTALASSTNPTTWSTFAEAFSAYQRDPSLSGVGFVLHAQGIVGVDLAHAVADDGRIKPWAAAIMDRLDGAHWERSPGGHGLRGICRGELPPGRRNVSYQDGRVEMYDDGRFLTITGVAP